MSRVGKVPIAIPDDVKLDVRDGRVLVKGPKGELSVTLHPHVVVTLQEKTVVVTVRHPDEKRDRALWGLFRVLLDNSIVGVRQGFSKQLEIQGVGFRAAVEGQNVTLNLGFSHPVTFAIPAGISVTVEKNIITVSGIDKQQVGEITAEIRRLRPPEPYKGKGIRYVGEQVRRKAGKVVKAAGAK